MTTDVQSCAKKSRGRPKVFDRDAALDKAMTLFWQHGYEATSLADLVEATGAKAPTLYAEFVNKEGLFRAVLDRYISRFAAKHEAVLFAEGKSVDRALRDYFTAVATCFTSKETPAGCFIINTSAALAASSVNIVVRPWVKTGDYWGVWFDFHEKVKLTFDAEGIEIPFPQRVVHMQKTAD